VLEEHSRLFLKVTALTVIPASFQLLLQRAVVAAVEARLKAGAEAQVVVPEALVLVFFFLLRLGLLIKDSLVALTCRVVVLLIVTALPLPAVVVVVLVQSVRLPHLRVTLEMVALV
jgi:hypothetical protein